MNLDLEIYYVRVYNKIYHIKLRMGYILLIITDDVITNVIYKRHLISEGEVIDLDEESKQKIIDKWPFLSFYSS